MTSTITAALAAKTGLYELVKRVMAAGTDTQNVYVVPGAIGTDLPDDIISLGKFRVTQEMAGMGLMRPREETITLEVVFSCLKGGGDEVELLSQQRALDLLGMVEREVRMNDPVLGGAVRQCFLTDIESDGVTPEDYKKAGRGVDVIATFTAQNRVRG
ncbi:hypothetical protein SPF06_07055 [Sinomonas sp. JGH33]|uniref:Tail terminator n=1 Tax=Sinomonas terricola TaxID=3110330 RepID=A0ABU5T4H2_9MICC|nr:hypothetical protein [Sinomonas sp. JGH33]MEA5454475.1 hypothetical protein [Sinomonas sp. JGH33]